MHVCFYSKQKLIGAKEVFLRLEKSLFRHLHPLLFFPFFVFPFWAFYFIRNVTNATHLYKHFVQIKVNSHRICLWLGQYSIHISIYFSLQNAFFHEKERRIKSEKTFWFWKHWIAFYAAFEWLTIITRANSICVDDIIQMHVETK